MGKYLRMILVLVGISLVSGLALGGLNSLTKDKIENNILRYRKIPAVISIGEGISGPLSKEQADAMADKLLAEKREIELEDGTKLVFFVVSKNDQPFAIAFDTSSKGYNGGEVGVMVGFNLQTGNLVGIGTTTVDQTPGVGKRIEEQSFTMQFRGLGIDSVFKVKKDKGVIDAVSGATLSSRAAALDVANAVEIFKKYEQQIKQAVNNQPGS